MTSVGTWEIRRKSKPLGVNLTGNGYQSELPPSLPCAGR